MLGNVIGEFLGELFLNGFFLVAALNNTVLPLWMLTLGVTLSLTHPRATQSQASTK